LDGGDVKPSSDEPMSTGRAVLTAAVLFEGGARLGGGGRFESLSDEPTSIGGFAGAPFAAGLNGGNVMLSSDESLSNGRAALTAAVLFEGGARLGGGRRADRVSNEPTSVASFVGAAALVAEAVF
jgi:hypothetical protein